VVLRPVVIVLLVFSLFFFSGCSYKKQPIASADISYSDDFNQGDPDQLNNSLKTNLKKATDYAKTWQKDAYFAGISLKLTADFKPSELENTFIFGSEQDTKNWLTYTTKSDGFLRALIPKEDFLGNGLKKIDQSFWKKSYLEAIKITEANGGIKFRAENSTAQLLVLLRRGEPNDWLWWEVIYKSQNNKEVKFLISAENGNLYDSKGQPVGVIQKQTETTPSEIK